jgi:hypothetical protein
MNPEKQLTLFWDGGTVKVPKRDNQRSKLYEAERAAFGSDFRALLSDGDLQAAIRFVRQVESSKTWDDLVAQSGRSKIQLTVKDGRGRLVLPRWARTKPVILHEMAHAVVPEARHNWLFCLIFLKLVGVFIGAEARDRLKAQFKAHRVRFRPQRQMSPETLLRLRAQGQKLAARRAEQQP